MANSSSWYHDDLGIPLEQLSVSEDRIPYDLFRNLSIRNPSSNANQSIGGDLTHQDELPDNWNWNEFNEPIEEGLNTGSSSARRYRAFDVQPMDTNDRSSSRYQRVFNTGRATVEMPIGPYPSDTFWNPNRETQKQIYSGRAWLVYHAVENPKELEALAKIDYPLNESTGPTQMTPLMLASKNGNIESMVIILLYGVNPELGLDLSYLLDRVDLEHQTALTHAVKANQVLAVKELLSWGKQMSQQTSIVNLERRTPLFIAAMNGNLPIVRLLLTADWRTLDVLDENGLTPLDAAAMQGHLSVIAYLRENRARGGPRSYALGDNQRWLTMPLEELEAEIASRDRSTIPIF